MKRGNMTMKCTCGLELYEHDIITSADEGLYGTLYAGNTNTIRREKNDNRIFIRRRVSS